MGCPQVIGTYPFSVFASSTEPAWLPVGSPLLVHGADTLEMVVKLTRATGDAQASAGVELFATRTTVAASDPTAATGGYTGTNGAAVHYTYDLGSDTSHFYVQPGVLAKLGGTTQGFVQGTISVVLGSCGRLAGQREVEAFLYEESARAWQYPIGGWMPALNADKLRAVLLGTNITDVDWRFYARLANDTDAPTSMTGLGTGFTAFSPDGSGNAEVNTGLLDLSGLSVSSYQLLQVVLALKMKSAGDNPKAYLKAIAALSYT